MNMDMTIVCKVIAPVLMRVSLVTIVLGYVYWDMNYVKEPQSAEKLFSFGDYFQWHQAGVQKSVHDVFVNASCECVYTRIFGFICIYYTTITSNVGRFACAIGMWMLVCIWQFLIVICFTEQSIMQWLQVPHMGTVHSVLIASAYVAQKPILSNILTTIVVQASLCLDVMKNRPIMVRYAVLSLMVVRVIEVWNTPTWVRTCVNQVRQYYIMIDNMFDTAQKTIVRLVARVKTLEVRSRPYRVKIIEIVQMLSTIAGTRAMECVFVLMFCGTVVANAVQYAVAEIGKMAVFAFEQCKLQYIELNNAYIAYRTPVLQVAAPVAAPVHQVAAQVAASVPPVVKMEDPVFRMAAPVAAPVHKAAAPVAALVHQMEADIDSNSNASAGLPVENVAKKIRGRPFKAASKTSKLMKRSIIVSSVLSDENANVKKKVPKGRRPRVIKANGPRIVKPADPNKQNAAQKKQNAAQKEQNAAQNKRKASSQFDGPVKKPKK